MVYFFPQPEDKAFAAEQPERRGGGRRLGRADGLRLGSKVVQGVMATLTVGGLEVYEIINLGNHRCEELPRVIELLEKELQVKTRQELLPIQPGDVPATYADIVRAQAKLGFQPTTPIDVGTPLRQIVSGLSWVGATGKGRYLKKAFGATVSRFRWTLVFLPNLRLRPFNGYRWDLLFPSLSSSPIIRVLNFN